MNHFSNKTVLVTGAASGIGRETALAFARQGAALVICDVDKVRLDETAAIARELGHNVMARVVDVADRNAMRSFSEEVHQGHAVDVLVNNAGVAIAGGFLDTSLEDWDWIMGINLNGVIHGCHFFVPKMVERKSGYVVNVSSVAGYLGSGVLAAYCTTKFGVFGLSESLREELHPHGIGVATICPGIVNTPIVQSTRLRGRHATSEMRNRSQALYKKRNYGPERVATAIVDAVLHRKQVVPVTPEAWAIYWMKRIAPKTMAAVGRAFVKQAGG